MSCRPWEEPAPVSEPENPVAHTKPSCNDGASHADPDAEDPSAQSDEEEELGVRKIRQPRHVLKYEVVKRWLTGERAKQDEDKTEAEREEFMRQYMELSGQRKFFVHKINSTDKGLWNLGRSYTD